jgi:hemoglobin-like flavoprotein
MTPKQIELVQSTWRQVLPIREDAAGIFYAKLFELNPALRELFASDLHAQGRKLISMITTVVRDLGRFEKHLEAIRILGERHRHCGVKSEDYRAVESALLYSLKLNLGQAFKRDAREAWIMAYRLISLTMQNRAEYQAA